MGPLNTAAFWGSPPRPKVLRKPPKLRNSKQIFLPSEPLSEASGNTRRKRIQGWVMGWGGAHSPHLKGFSQEVSPPTGDPVISLFLTEASSRPWGKKNPTFCHKD